jgi:hypothetical protein
VAVGQGVNTILTSTNGLEWTGVTGTTFSVGSGVTWNGSRWVAVGYRSDQVSILTSTDGINWSSNGVTGASFSDGFGAVGYGVASNNVWKMTPASPQDAMTKFLQSYYLRFGPI